MLKAFASLAQRISQNWRAHVAQPLHEYVTQPTAKLGPLERVVLTDGVSRTLFDQYAEHRSSFRGVEETGWVLLGLRHHNQALALATLPAGTQREAGVAHVRFNSDAQAVGSRILRQDDRQLDILGVVHTHPGTLRHPSNGDFEGDKQWVRLLRGREGVFGIGTADGDVNRPSIALQPDRHSQCYRGLRLSWYALGEKDKHYRTLPMEVTLGLDLAQPLQSIWGTLETHAEPLDRLCRQLAKVRFQVVSKQKESALHILVPLQGLDENLRVILRGEEIEYYLGSKDDWFRTEQEELNVERGVYMMLADLAAHRDNSGHISHSLQASRR